MSATVIAHIIYHAPSFINIHVRHPAENRLPMHVDNYINFTLDSIALTRDEIARLYFTPIPNRFKIHLILSMGGIFLTCFH